MLAFAQQSNITLLHGGKSNEWYTPARYIEAARAVMGGIDLDPASCELANRTVRAIRYCTQADNGLVQPWYGRIWLNPPFCKDKDVPRDHQSSIAKWVEKLLVSYQERNVSQAVLLIMARQESKWFQLLWDYTICFADHHVRFNLPFGCTRQSREGWKTDAHQFGTCFVYLGNNEQTFISTFSAFGTIAKRISTPKVQPVPMNLWEGVQG